MKSFFRIFTVVMIMSGILFSFGCARKEESKIKNEVVTASNLADLVEQMKSDKLFTKDDIEYFSSTVLRYQNTLDSLNGKTIGQLIEKQKDYLRDASMIGLVNTTINTIQGFGYLGWQPLEQNNQKFFVFGFAIQNKAKQDLKKVEGLLKFVTNNNQLIKGFKISVNQEVKSAQTAQFTSTFVMDTANKNDLLLLELLKTKNPNIYPVWQPSSIELADGKKIVVPTIQ